MISERALAAFFLWCLSASCPIQAVLSTKFVGMDAAKREARNARRRKAFADKSEADKEVFRAKQRARYAARKEASQSNASDAQDNAAAGVASSSGRSRVGKQVNYRAYVDPLFYPSNQMRSDMRAAFLSNPDSYSHVHDVTPLLPEVDRCGYCGAFRFYYHCFTPQGQ